MCLNPIQLPDGNLVACQKCWQCVRNKVDDWTGRCIAERQVSAAAHCVTLTYGRDEMYDGIDHLKAAVLTYSDVQKCLKLMRKDGLKVRYFVVGEYGALKGRAHWHALFFWGQDVPQVELRKRVDARWWVHGSTFWDELTPETVAYVCKYVAKEVESEDRAFHMGMSRHPPLGDGFFRSLAQEYIANRLAPQDFYYGFDGVERKGKPRRFNMRGKTRENFLRYFRDGWWETYGDHPPNSEILEVFEDLETVRGSQDEAQRVLAAEKVGLMGLRDSVTPRESTLPLKKPKAWQLRDWMQADRLHFSESLNVWLYEFEGQQRPWYWARDEQGEWGWRHVIGASAKNDRTPSYQRVSRGGD